MSTLQSRIATLLVLAALATSSATAAPPSPTAPASPAPQGTSGQTAPEHPATTSKPVVSADDHNFMIMATESGLTEIELGRQAEKMATSPEVKRFAHMLVNDHTAANKRLEDIASKLGVKLPTAPTARQAAMVKRLSEMKGAAYDKAWIAYAVAAHRTGLAAFRRVAQHTRNPQLKQFATRNETVLTHHLQTAESVARSVHASAAPTTERAHGPEDVTPKKTP